VKVDFNIAALKGNKVTFTQKKGFSPSGGGGLITEPIQLAIFLPFPDVSTLGCGMLLIQSLTMLN